MRKRNSVIVRAAVLLIAAVSPLAAAERVVSLGGAVTEIVYALGAGDALVAVDSTSTYPAEADALPDVGYVRALSAEGILALRPELVLASAEAGPPNVIEQLRAAGVAVVLVPGKLTLEATDERIQAVAAALGAGEAGKKLAADFAADRAELEAVVADASPVLAAYVMMRGDGVLLAAGRGTAAETMLTAAGLQNVMATYDGYKPISAEALVALGPEVIVTGKRTVGAAGGTAGFAKHAAVALTPAAANGRILVFDDLYLLGMGPRAASAAAELAQAARR